MIARRLGWLGLLLGLASQLAGCGDEPGYTRKDGRWHHDNAPVAVADPRSFLPLDALFARDAVQGYYRGQPVAGSHGASFQALSAHEARDRQAVYWADTYRKAQEYWAWSHIRARVIEGADPASYQVLGHGYARDARSAWYEGRAFAVRDPASFTPIDSRFARDAQRGYFDRTEVPDSDGASFEVLAEDGGSHARDRQRVYSLHIELNDPLKPPHAVIRVLDGAWPATVRVPGRGYAVDGARVWWRGRLVAGADGSSFQVLETGSGRGDVDGQDARSTYVEGRRQAVAVARSSPP